MLYIENIDDCNFTLHGSISIAGLKILGKKEWFAKACEPIYNDVTGRVNILNKNKKEKLVGRKPVNEVNIDGVVYATAQEFVAAFNALMNTCCCLETTTIEPTTTFLCNIQYTIDDISEHIVTTTIL